MSDGGDELWFILWACFCTDVAADAAEFDERCPCHDAERVGCSPILPGVSTNLGHMCGANQ